LRWGQPYRGLGRCACRQRQLRGLLRDLDSGICPRRRGWRIRRCSHSRDLLALDVGASVTGEGVETAAQLETLGVDQAQGYLLARPSTDIDTWEEWWTRGQDTDDIGTAFSPPLPGTGR